jgi:putative oxidoreductase
MKFKQGVSMKFLGNLSPYAHWLLRISFTSVFLFHGIIKFPKLSVLSQLLGIPVALVILIPLMEVGGGVLVFLGGFFKDWMTRIGAIITMPVIIGAIVKFHWGQWAYFPSEAHPLGGMQFQTTILLLQLFFIILGNKINFGRSSTTTT